MRNVAAQMLQLDMSTDGQSISQLENWPVGQCVGQCVGQLITSWVVIYELICSVGLSAVSQSVGQSVSQSVGHLQSGVLRPSC